MVEIENCQKLSDLVEKLTTSGQKIPDKCQLTELKKICRLSDEYVKHVHRLVLSQLEKDHAEIRLSAFQIVDELFMRSHCFRELLLADLQRYMELTMEIDVRQPLPLPNLAAVELKHKSLEAISRWNSKFSSTYKLLALGFNFLKTCRKIDFQNISTSTTFTPADQRRVAELRVKRARQYETRIQRTLTEMTDLTDDIKMCLLESENCLTLLLPHPDDFHININDAPSHERSRRKSNLLPVKSSTDKYSPLKTGDARLSPVESTPYSSNQLKADKNEKSNEGNVCSETVSHCSGDTTTNDVDEDDVADTECDSVCEVLSNASGALARHGSVGLKTVNLSIDISSIQRIDITETCNNSDVIRTLKDQVALINNKFAPAVKKWLEVFTKTDAPQVNIRAALDLKTALDNELKKINILNIICKPSQSEDRVRDSSVVSEDSDSDSDEFVEVPSKEWFAPCIRDRLKSDELLSSSALLKSLLPTATETTHELNATNLARNSSANDMYAAGTSTQQDFVPCSTDTKCKGETGESSPSDDNSVLSSRQKLLMTAPIVPFGNDLYFWGDNSVAPKVQRNDVGTHRWWTTQEPEEAVDAHALADIRLRAINFTGTFVPVKWKCRAPLLTGKLCERMDRIKCPFHGKIIARDETGQPRDPQEQQAQASEANVAAASAWEDPTLQAQILAATGVDVSRKGKTNRKGKSKAKKLKTGLTNIGAINKNTPRKRLESKVLKSSTLKRVANAMDRIDFKRANDKFSSNFNYAFQL